MIRFDNGGILLQEGDDLPDFIGATNVYLDLETSSGSALEDSLNPWQNCKIAGLAITVDDCQNGYYIDWLSASKSFIEKVTRWINSILQYCENWINHNIKYDANVLLCTTDIEIPPHVNLICTIVQAKLIDSDRVSRGGYALDKLSKDWLGRDISHHEIKLAPYLVKNKDYGRIPCDILGEYACDDVLTNRLLWQHIQSKLPERCKGVSKTEIAVTRQLLNCEQRGLMYDVADLKIAQYAGLNRMCELDDKLRKLTGHPVNARSSDDCYELLVGQYGLPVIKYTRDSSGEETENASFDKHVLAAYKADPYAPQEVIDALIEIRLLQQLDSLYYVPWQQLAPDGVIHSDYNQVVRTGRMSCRRPNAQQIKKSIKKLIIPRPGYSIFESDASQIEFRLIVHYIRNAMGIDAYRNDPNTDFHIFVAYMAHVKRKLGKTINFGTAFGEGKRKLLSQIAADPGVVAEVKAEVDLLNLQNIGEQVVEFRRRIEIRANEIYDAYHGLFPELKPTTKLAETVCKSLERRCLFDAINDGKHCYGYITNSYGRDRHLPYCLYRTDYGTRDPLDKAWLAFSTLNQSSAADLMKERLVELMWQLYSSDTHLLACVHDAIVLEVRNDIADDPRFERDTVGILESPARDFLVPIRWSAGCSKENWYKASESIDDGGTSRLFQYNKAECQNFSWLGV